MTAADRDLTPLVPVELIQQLARLERLARWLSLAGRLGMAAAVLVAISAAGLALDFLWDLPYPARVSLLGAAALAAVAGLGWALALFLKPGHDLSATAAVVEAAHPELQERLISAVELADPDSANGSILMRSIVQHQAQQSLSRIRPNHALPLGRAGRRALFGVVMLSLLLVPSQFSDSYRLLVQRFLAPWENLPRVSNLYFAVEPEDAAVAHGSDVSIAARPHWRLWKGTVPADVWLRCRDQRGEFTQRRMTWHDGDQVFLATVPQVLQPFEFDVSSGRARTRTYRIEVIERPSLAAITATVEPPPYSGRAVEQYEGAVGEMEMLQGSRLLLAMRFSKPVRQAELIWVPDPEPESVPPTPVVRQLVLNEEGRGAEVEWQPEASGRFALRLIDDSGIQNGKEPPRHVTIIPDRAPEVRFADAVAEQQAGPGDVLRFPVIAQDDIAVAALELHYEVVGGDESPRHIDVERSQLGTPSAEHEFQLDLRPLQLANGAVLAVRACAADERPEPGPNESWTEPRLITIHQHSDPYGSAALAERQRRMFEELQGLRNAVEESRTAAEDLQAHAAEQAGKNAAFERDSEAAELAAKEQELIGRAERLAAAFDEHPLLESLAERMRQVASDPLTSAAEHTAQAARPQNSDKASGFQASAEQLAKAAEELQSRHEDLTQLAELEQDLLELQRLADDTERLAADVDSLQQRKDALTQKDNAADQQQLALEAEQLRFEHSELEDRLNDLLDRRPELLDAAETHYLEQLQMLGRQAQSLSEREQALAAVIEREAQNGPQPPSEDPPPDEQPTSDDAPPSGNPTSEDAAPQEQSADADAATPDDTPEPSASEATEDDRAPTPEVARTEESPSDDMSPANEPTPSDANSDESSSIDEMHQHQLNLLQQAAELAARSADENGELSPAVRQAVEQAAAAAESIASGDLAGAAAASEHAADSADSAAADESPLAGTESDEATRLREFAAEQRKLAQQMLMAAESPEIRAAAQARSQQLLAESAGQLHQQLEQVAGELDSAPLNRNESAKCASGACAAARHAQELMVSASAAQAEGNLPSAAASASEAAKQLQAAAELVETGRPQPPPTPVPGEVGQQVAQASRQLQNAGRQLADAPTPPQSPEADDQPPDAEPATANAEPPESAQGKLPPGVEPLGDEQQANPRMPDAASGLKRAAEALQTAARRLRPGQKGAAQEGTSSGSAVAAKAGSANPNGDPSGTGSMETLQMADLAARLKARSMRNWGQLPGELQSEVQNRSRKRPNADYAPLIRLYFDEISRRQSPLTESTE